MTSLTIALGALSLLTLAALMLAVTAICQVRSAARATLKRQEAAASEAAAGLQALRSNVDGLAAQVHNMQQLPQQTAAPVPPRGGLNLGKRSQALRLHRHGAAPEQIASTLEIPLQEVELLLKVHRIVIGSLPN